MTTPTAVESRSARGSAVLTIEIRAAGDFLRTLGLILIAVGVATSSLTFSWIIESDPRVNLFPEFIGRVIYLSDVPLLAGVAVWLGGWRLAGAPRLNLGPAYVAFPLLLLMALTALSIVWAVDPGLTGFAITRRFLLLGVYIVLASDGQRVTTAFIGILYAIVLLHIAVAWAQVRQGTLLGLTMLGELPETGQFGCPPRPPALAFNANPLGMLVAVGDAVAYGVFLFAGEGRSKKALRLVPFAIGLLGLLLTQSRSAYFGWLGGVCTMTLLAWFWNPAKRRQLLTSAVVASVVTVAVHWSFPLLSPLAPHCGGERTNRFSPSNVMSSAFIRFADYGLSAQVIREHVWLGVGASNYPLQLSRRLPPNPTPAFTPVHNVALLLWVELGIAGLASWLAILSAPAVWTARRRHATHVARSELLWLAPLLAIFAVSMLDFTPWATQDGRVLTMAVLGLWAGGVTDHRTDPHGRLAGASV